MQVNSAQDYLTNRKRQIIAATYQTTPPPQSRKYNATYLSAVGNNATQRQRFIAPTNTGIGGTPTLGAVFTSLCCLPTTGVLGTFNTVTTQGQIGVRDLNLAMSYRAT